MFKKIRMILWVVLLMGSVYAELPPARAKASKKYNLSVCALFKNEARFLKEWLEYHLLVGVDHFYLYNNGSQDRFKDVLNPYIKKGVVTLINWPSILEFKDEEQICMWVLSTQITAYENAVKVRTPHETKWLVFIDVSEFLVPGQSNKLNQVLEKYSDSSAVTMQTEFYDASKIDTLPRRKLLIETVEMIGPQLIPPKEVAKTIFKPDLCEGFTWPPYKCLFQNRQEAVKLQKEELRLNRYLSRWKGCIGTGKPREKLCIDTRAISEKEKENLLEEGYEITDQECAIHRFIAPLLKKLGFEIWDF